MIADLPRRRSRRCGGRDLGGMRVNFPQEQGIGRRSCRPGDSAAIGQERARRPTSATQSARQGWVATRRPEPAELQLGQALPVVGQHPGQFAQRLLTPARVQHRAGLPATKRHQADPDKLGRQRGGAGLSGVDRFGRAEFQWPSKTDCKVVASRMRSTQMSSCSSVAALRRAGSARRVGRSVWIAGEPEIAESLSRAGVESLTLCQYN